jgi:hypothetical protein
LSLLFRLVPAFDSVRGYGRSEARGDLVTGLTVATVALPQAMAYALVAGLPVEYGLHTAIVSPCVTTSRSGWETRRFRTIDRMARMHDIRSRMPSKLGLTSGVQARVKTHSSSPRRRPTRRGGLAQ